MKILSFFAENDCGLHTFHRFFYSYRITYTDEKKLINDITPLTVLLKNKGTRTE